MSDSPEYLKRKEFFARMLTIYGRKPCLEAMTDANVEIYRLHLADSNKPASILDDIVKQAKQRGADIIYHDKKSLSRISKNGKQDQGVAVDLLLRGFADVSDFLQPGLSPGSEFIALDGVTNPQNLGMIIRSVCASPMRGLIIPNQGCAKLDSLVIKASAGTLFRSTIIRCQQLADCLTAFRQQGADIIGLDVDGTATPAELTGQTSKVFVLGNETRGLSPQVEKLCSQRVRIPMHNGVESLNVATTAGIIAFRRV